MNKKVLFGIALKNVLRRRKQTISLFLMLAVTTFSIGASVAFRAGASDSIKDTYTSLISGDAQIRNKKYEEVKDYDKVIKGEDIDLQKIANLDRFKYYSGKRTYQFMVIEAKNKNSAIQMVGVEPEKEKNISKIPTFIVEGRYLNDDDINGIVVGVKLAEFLKLKVGDEITVMGQDIDESLMIEVFKVVGIFKSKDEMTDKMFGFVNIITYQDLFMYGDYANSITFRLENPKLVHKFVKTLNKGLQNNDYTAITWEKIIPEIVQILMFSAILDYLFFIVFIIVIAFAVLNSIYLSSIKRIPEMGLLNSMGLQNADIKWILIYEVLLIVTVAVIVGTIGNFIFVYLFADSGIDIGKMVSKEAMEDAKYAMSNIVYPKLTLPTFSFGVLSIYFSSLCSLILPLKRLKTLDPVQALKDV